MPTLNSTLLVAIVLGVLGAPALGQAATPTCTRQEGTTLLANAQARVYETEPFASEGGKLSTLLACRVGSRRHVTLAEDYEDPFGGSDTYSSIRLAGLRVAFVFTQISPDAGTTREVDRVDLGGGGKVSAKVARPVTLVMSRAGGVAWIESGAVSALGAAGGRSILDAGPVEPRSLRRAGRSGVSWLRDGTRHTAAVN